MISIDRYLERIGYSGSRSPTQDLLSALHLAHAETIPFENLDIHFGRPIRNDLEGLVDKLVVRRRGGYCFEQNGLFAAMLDGLGFRLRKVLGRATFGAPSPRPRGHLLSLVEVGSRRWIADVGFGGYGLLEPVPFEIGRLHTAGGETYRIVHVETGGFELEMKETECWKSLYWFDETLCYPVDIDIMNFYHSYSPDSFFHQNRVVALARRGLRKTLTNGELKIIRGTTVESLKIKDEDAYRRVLTKDFGIELPADCSSSIRPRPDIAAVLPAAGTQRRTTVN